LKKKHLKLDAVVELRVNESALLERVETRVAQMRERGEEVRIDDTPEVLTKRLASYRALTEPLIHYYSERRKLLTVDGMMTIEAVTREIEPNPVRDRRGEAKVAKKAGAAKRTAKTAKKAAEAARKSPGKAARKSAKKGSKATGKGAKVAKPAAKRIKRGLKGPPARCLWVPGPVPSPRPRKRPRRSRKSEPRRSDG